jgi:hypothetical protein
VIWPSASQPDVALSVGTGFLENSTARTTGKPLRGILCDGFIPRLFRSLMSSPSLHGQNSWAALMNRLNEDQRRDYFRLNLPLKGKEPSLDDVSQMSFLQQSVAAHVRRSNMCAEIGLALWAASFFFELEGRPSFSNGLYTCKGSILCRRPNGVLLVDQIMRKYPTAQFMCKSEKILGSLGKHNGCPHCGYFCKLVSFDVRHLDESFTLYLVYQKRLQHKISAFPHPATWFMEQQKLDDPFAREHYWLRETRRRCFCSSRKRRVQFPDGRHTSKRRNLGQAPTIAPHNLSTI